MKEKNKSLLIILIGIIFWMTYIYDSEMSRYGIYTTHEVLSAIPLLSTILTMVWLISLVIKSIREKSIKTHKLIYKSIHKKMNKGLPLCYSDNSLFIHPSTFGINDLQTSKYPPHNVKLSEPSLYPFQYFLLLRH